MTKAIIIGVPPIDGDLHHILAKEIIEHKKDNVVIATVVDNENKEKQLTISDIAKKIKPINYDKIISIIDKI